jgi:hypothetical protein
MAEDILREEALPATTLRYQYQGYHIRVGQTRFTIRKQINIEFDTRTFQGRNHHNNNHYWSEGKCYLSKNQLSYLAYLYTHLLIALIG